MSLFKAGNSLWDGTSILQMRKLKHRELKESVQGDKGGKPQRWNLTPDSSPWLQRPKSFKKFIYLTALGLSCGMEIGTWKERCQERTKCPLPGDSRLPQGGSRWSSSREGSFGSRWMGELGNWQISFFWRRSQIFCCRMKWWKRFSPVFPQYLANIVASLF